MIKTFTLIGVLSVIAVYLQAQEPVQAYIIKVESEWVYLDRGRTDGIYEGLELDVNRDGVQETIARLQIDQVFDETSRARILQRNSQEPLRVLDFVRIRIGSKSAEAGPVAAADDKLLAPLLAHHPADFADAGKEFRITVRAAGVDGLTSVELNYRLGAQDAWTRMDMEPLVGDVYTAGLPGGLMRPGMLQYYIVATDIDRRRGFIGSPTEPVHVEIAAPGGPHRRERTFLVRSLIPGQVQVDNGYLMKGTAFRIAQAGALVVAFLDSGRWPLWAGVNAAIYGLNVADAHFWSDARGRQGMIQLNIQRPDNPLAKLRLSWSW